MCTEFHTSAACYGLHVVLSLHLLSFLFTSLTVSHMKPFHLYILSSHRLDNQAGFFQTVKDDVTSGSNTHSVVIRVTHGVTLRRYVAPMRVKVGVKEWTVGWMLPHAKFHPIRVGMEV